MGRFFIFIVSDISNVVNYKFGNDLHNFVLEISQKHDMIIEQVDITLKC